MGYTTEFKGQFKLDKPLSKEHQEYLTLFSKTRRMKRDTNIAIQLKDSVREAADLPIGVEAEYFVGGEGFYGQDHDGSITEYNLPPSTQPGLWCQWIPNKDGTAIEWNGGEKFYYYTAWLEYLIVNFIVPWSYKLNGTISWQGEEDGDKGKIKVRDNMIVVFDK